MKEKIKLPNTENWWFFLPVFRVVHICRVGVCSASELEANATECFTRHYIALWSTEDMLYCTEVILYSAIKYWGHAIWHWGHAIQHYEVPMSCYMALQSASTALHR